MMGRFQPFHLGHLWLAKQILAECDELVVAVTSAQFNYIKKDPFTAGERIEMIHDSLEEADSDMSACFVTAIENQFNIATWGGYLMSSLPKFERVYSGNPYVAMLLTDLGINVIVPNLLNRTQYNATAIRQMIVSGDDVNWQKLVPNAVCKLLKKIDAQRRLSIIYDSDTRPVEH